MTQVQNVWKKVFGKRPLLMTGLSLLVIGLPVSLFLTSLAQFFLAGSFFLEGSWKDKFRRFFNDRMALLLAGIWVLHLIGMAWTDDLHEGWKDLRVKLPLFVLPIMLSGSGPIGKKQLRFLLHLFVVTVVAATWIHTAILAGGSVTDIREIYVFGISHIRFALFCCLSIVICQWLAAQGKQRSSAGWLYLLTQLWITAFLFVTASVTGLGILGVLVLIYLTVLIVRHGRMLPAFVLLSSLTVATMGCWKLAETTWRKSTERKDYPVPVHAYSKEGNYYYTDTAQSSYENGYPVWVEICDQELAREWNLRSTIQYGSSDRKGQPLRTTLIRFLASKGMKKDAESVRSLSRSEISGIENGIANVSYLYDPEIIRRSKEVVWEIADYRQGGDANGHSLTQRLEFWQAALHIIRHYPWLGAGTGDMPAAFRNAYEELNSRLLPGHRLRSHNQYLAIAVAFGHIGLFYFLAVFFGVLLAGLRKGDLLLTGCWLILALSMLTEDTLETQPGATFFALFLSLLLFSRSPVQHQSDARTSL